MSRRLTVNNDLEPVGMTTQERHNKNPMMTKPRLCARRAEQFLSERLPEEKRSPVPLTAMSAWWCFSRYADQKRTERRIEPTKVESDLYRLKRLCQPKSVK